MTTLILPLFTFLLLAGNLKWITHLEKSDCECSQDRRRTFIKYYYMLAIGSVLAEAWASFNPAHAETIDRFISTPMLGVALAYVGVALSYVVDLRKKECECFEGDEARMLFWGTLGLAIYTLAMIFIRARQ
jgi:hypothetical protein